MIKLLHRYIARELVFPFAMGAFVFTFILLMDKLFTLADLIVKYGVPLHLVGKLLLLILPATFAITIPMGCLVAAMVCFSRLKADNEITALKASGISPLPLLFLVLGLGLGLAASMIWFNNTLLPAANYGYRSLYYQIVKQRAAIVIKPGVFIEDFDRYVFRVESVDPRSNRLRNIVIMIKPEKPRDPLRLIVAKQGRLLSDEDARRVMLQLESGVMHFSNPSEPEMLTQIQFEQQLIDLDIHRELQRQDSEMDKSAREMSMSEIAEQIRLATLSRSWREVPRLQVEWHKKLSIPFACFAFVLLGGPLGLLAPPSGRYLSYFAGIILIFLYYILISVGEALGADGKIPAWLSMWLPNILLCLAGAYTVLWVTWERQPLTFFFTLRKRV
jgi:lipopolysaccharide export system permease protein